jgi:hypothetical protein
VVKVRTLCMSLENKICHGYVARTIQDQRCSASGLESWTAGPASKIQCRTDFGSSWCIHGGDLFRPHACEFQWRWRWQLAEQQYLLPVVCTERGSGASGLECSEPGASIGGPE